MKKKLILGITGSVAATLTPKLVKALIDTDNFDIKIISTTRGLYFFDPKSIPIEVLTDKYEWPEGGYIKNSPVPHIDLGDWADMMLIAPITADTISDIAHGKSDKFLTSTVLAWPKEKQLILAPAMNTRMWENSITQENIDKIEDTYRTTIISPIEGHLACGITGIGAMARIENIVQLLCSI